MIKKLRDLISSFSEKTEDADIQDISDLDNACAALLVEIAFADKDFNESEQDSLKKSLMECYKISEEDINEIIEDNRIQINTHRTKQSILFSSSSIKKEFSKINVKIIDSSIEVKQKTKKIRKRVINVSS